MENKDTITIDGKTMTIDEYVGRQEAKQKKEDISFVTREEVKSRSRIVALDRRRYVRRGKRAEAKRKTVNGRYLSEPEIFFEHAKRIGRRIAMNGAAEGKKRSKGYRYLERVLKSEMEDWWSTKDMCNRALDREECSAAGKMAQLSQINKFLVEQKILARREKPPQGGKGPVFRVKAELKDPVDKVAPGIYQEYLDWQNEKRKKIKRPAADAVPTSTPCTIEFDPGEPIQQRIQLLVEIEVRVRTVTETKEE